MIISASRRTDIPAFHSDWFINRLKSGYCLVKNPFNPLQIRRVSLLQEDVSGIVLWTKNADPILKSEKFSTLAQFPYYFQYSVTPYNTDIEYGLESKRDVIIPAFLELASRIGARRVIWRYDPIIITEKYNFSYHAEAFSRLCGLLGGSTEKCVISFVVAYKSVTKSLAEIGCKELQTAEKIELSKTLLSIAESHGITLCACCESSELYQLGIKPISCVDSDLLGEIGNRPLNIPRDKNQRKGCNCAASADIGAYNSCMNGCRYCYANHSPTKVRENYMKRDVNAEILIN